MKNKVFKRIFVLPIFFFGGIFIFLGVVGPAQAEDQPTWVLKTPMPIAMSAPASGVIDGKIYLAGGSGVANEALNNLIVYDPATDSWAEKPDMSAGRWGLTAGIIDGKYYTVVGGSPIPYGSVKTEVFDPETNEWQEKSDMPNPGWGVTSGVVNNKLYVIGGYNWPNWGMDLNREYNPATNQWTLKAPMPTKRSWFGSEVIDNKLYAVGGWNWNDTVDLPTLEVYDPTSDTWTARASMPIGLRSFATASSGGKLYVFGGYTGEGPSAVFYSTVFVYDPASDSWSQLSDLPLAIAGAVAEEINGQIYLFGGSTPTTTLNTTYSWQAQKEVDPVILIPGIMGSWEVQDEWRIDPIFHTYDNLMEAFIGAGYKESPADSQDKNLFTFAYDWRADNNLTAGLLKEKIEAVKNLTGRNKVDLVAHSMGGLVARSYIEGNSYQNDVDQLIFLGTPHAGSPESYLKYEGAYFQGHISAIQKYLFQIEAARYGYLDLVDYIRVKVPTVEQLLPIFSYLKDKQTDNSWQLRSYPLSYPQNNYLENLNSPENIGLLKQRVSITNVVSDLGPQSTLNFLRVIPDPDTNDNKWQSGYPENLNEGLDSLEYGRGDDTVPLTSAKSLNGVEIIETGADHANLPTVMQKEVIKSLTGAWPENYYNNKTISTIKRWLFFRVYSPVDFVVIAPDGKKIGKDFAGNAEINEIPEAFYSGFGSEVEFVLIPNPEEGEYQVKIQGTDEGGNYRLATSYIDNTEENNAEFFGSISPAAEKDFNLVYDPASENPVGELNPIDTLPPEITIIDPAAGKKYFHSDRLVVNYRITDDFSGLASTTIAIDGRMIATTTLNLFDYTLGPHILTINAVDKAGNEAMAQASFEIVANIDSAISDIEDINRRGWLSGKIYKALLVNAFKLLKIEAKFLEKEQDLVEKLIKNKKDDPRLSAKERKKLVDQYKKMLEKIKEKRAKAISKSLDLISKLLDSAKKQNQINQSGYDIINSDINYLRINL